MSQHFVFPAEWEQHECSWISWPHHEPDWPGKLEAVKWAYVELVRLIGSSEHVHVLCNSGSLLAEANEMLTRSGISDSLYSLHVLPTDRTWLRDSGPTAVRDQNGKISLVNWAFNAWAKYDNYQQDVKVPVRVAEVNKLPLIAAKRNDGSPFVLEGGAIDTDGEGTLLVTKECLLSKVQERNPGLDQKGYEELFAKYLGIKKTIWLERGCIGDDTHGHIDDIARFVAPTKVLLSWEENTEDPNHAVSLENYNSLFGQTDAKGRALEIIKLPVPRPMSHDGDLLPASYANFYITNKTVIVPTFNDVKDREALEIIASCFSDRETVGLCCVDFILGLGSVHCSTQQIPQGRF